MSKLGMYGVVVIGVFMFSACNSPGLPSAPVPSQPTMTPAAPLSATIVYEYSGGIAGFRKQLTIAAGGGVTLQDRGRVVGTMQLPKERLSSLVKQFEAVDFYNLKEKYEDEAHMVADDTYSTLTFTQGGRTKTVTVAMVGGSDLAPRGLMEVISELAQIVSEIEKSATPSP